MIPYQFNKAYLRRKSAPPPPPPEPLDTPVYSVDYVNAEVTWGAVTNAEYYLWRFNTDEEGEWRETINPAVFYPEPKDEYTTVMAYALNDTLGTTSQIAYFDVPTFQETLDEPEITTYPTEEDRTLVWEAVEGAVQYNINLEDEDGNVLLEHRTSYTDDYISDTIDLSEVSVIKIWAFNFWNYSYKEFSYPPTPPPPPVDPDYFWVKPIHEVLNGMFYFEYNGGTFDVDYKLDTDEEWSSYTFDQSFPTRIVIPPNHKLYFKGNNPLFNNQENGQIICCCERLYNNISYSSDWEVGGDLTTLLNEEGNVLDLSDYGSERQFRNFLEHYQDWNLKIYDCSELILPSTTITELSYSNLLRGQFITEAPVIEATTIGYRGLNYMFAGCTSLESIKLKATNITSADLGNNMFQKWVASGTMGGGAIETYGTLYYNGDQEPWETFRGDASGLPTNWTIETFTP